MRKLRMTIALGVLLAAAPALAQTLYKLIDKKGKVTYSETAPKDFDGKVIRIDIDPNANTATLPKPPAPPAKVTSDANPAPAPTATPKPSAESLREKVQNARKAFERVRDNPTEDDFRFIANAGGGTRRAPTEEYLARLAAAEQALKAAEDDAKKAEEAR